ncbi:MAG: CoA transferase [Gammaproteobacteria bacterium]|nr:CoA transferase [Gammaproteobacteria bacterium]
MMQQALGGRRVLKSPMPRASTAASCLADLGAEVIRLEPPGGDATRRIGPFPDGAGADDPGFSTAT